MKTRVVSAIILVLVFLPFLVMGGLPFAVFMTVLSLLGLRELF